MKFEILQETLHATHPLKLLDKMYKYEMDPSRTVGTTERTWDAGPTDGQMDRQTVWNQYTPLQLCCAEGMIKISRWPHMISQICGKIDPDNGLSPIWNQAIT